MEIFARVVAAGSMSGAGREMGLSPAVVSKRLTRLEERLGTRLCSAHAPDRADRSGSRLSRARGRDPGLGRGGRELRRAPVRSRARLLRVSAPTAFGASTSRRMWRRSSRPIPTSRSRSTCRTRFVDIVGEGFDMAVRIAALDDSSLVARRLAPNHRLMVAAPRYLASRGLPAEHRRPRAPQLPHRRPAGQLAPRRAGGPVSVRAQGNLQTNSSDVVREGGAVRPSGSRCARPGTSGPTSTRGRLQVVLPAYRGSVGSRIHRGLSEPALPAAEGAGVHRFPRRALRAGALLGPRSRRSRRSGRRGSRRGVSPFRP